MARREFPLSHPLFTFLLALGSVVFGPSAAQAALPEECPGLGIALVEHSCFHSTHGPFATRSATPGSEPSADTQDLNEVHTEYRVGLAGSESHVTYTPNRSGAFSIFLGSDVPLRVLRQGLREPKLVTFDEGTGCDALPVSHVFELGGDLEYQLVFGPTNTQNVVVVIEYVDDFLIANGRDQDGDGYGSRMDSIRSVCVPPAGYAQNTSDCDDTNPAVNPGAVEICGDEIDANCNGLPDDVGLACSAGEGACRRTGEFACDGGGTVCSATPAESSVEECNGVDDDCNGRIDDAANMCPDAARPTCVRDEFGAFCGCLLDLDCGPPDSARVCSLEERRCVPGCAATKGRNGCPEGYECEVEAGDNGECVEVPEPVPLPEAGAGGEGALGGSAPNAGGRGGGGGAGGLGGTGPSRGGTENGTAGEPSDPGGRGGQPASNEPERIIETRGCGCRVAPPANSPGWSAALIGLGVMLLLRRRRRGLGSVTRAGLLGAVLLSAGCGGRSIETTERDDGGHAGDHHHHHPHAGTTSSPAGTGGTGAGGEAVTPRGGSGTEGGSGGVVAAGNGGTGGTPCVPELAEEPISHSCSHMRLGPFVPVAALGPQRGPAADVSAVQTAFEVDVIEAGARIGYVASRDGKHVIFTNESVPLFVRDPSATILPSMAFPVSGCEAIVSGVSVMLRLGEAYTLEIGDGAAPAFEVFIEHLATFGDEAWAHRCDE